MYQTTDAVGTTTYSRANAYSEGSKYLPRMTEQTIAPNGYVVTTYRDLYGRVEGTEESTKQGSQVRTTRYQLDRFGKVTDKEVTAGNTTLGWKMRYAPDGQLVYLKDPESNVYEYGYDGLGNLTSVTENGVTFAAYTYNSLSWKGSRHETEKIVR